MALVTETSYKGMFKVSLDDKNYYYVRREYIDAEVFEYLEKNEPLRETFIEQLENASLICAVELKAVQYLARAEQSHFGLRRKLLQKKYNAQHVDKALSFLESADYLSDKRYARAWLNSRKINHYEGRQKLLSELLSRGISREVSLNALDEFFSENDEAEICLKACKKALKTCQSQEKLISSLLKSGFSMKEIKKVLEEMDITLSHS